MSLTTTPIGPPISHGTFKESAVGTTLTKNVRNGSTSLVAVDIAETSNANATSVKFYNDTGENVSLGTTLPDMVLKVSQNKRTVYHFPGNMLFLLGLSIAGATEDGKTVTSAPGASTVVRGVTT